jgi:hypothetical protein
MVSYILLSSEEALNVSNLKYNYFAAYLAAAADNGLSKCNEQ